MTTTDERELREAVKVVLKAFDDGLFVRCSDGDHKPDWATGLLRPMIALGKLKEFAESEATGEELI